MWPMDSSCCSGGWSEHTISATIHLQIRGSGALLRIGKAGVIDHAHIKARGVPLAAERPSAILTLSGIVCLCRTTVKEVLQLRLKRQAGRSAKEPGLADARKRPKYPGVS